MSLDCLTPKGIQAIEDVRRGLELVKYDYVETSQSTDADIDGFFVRGKEITGVFEAKARYKMNQHLLETKFKNEWILTYSKLVKGSQISKALRTPFCGVLYMVDERKVMVIKITDEKGNIIVPVRVLVTPTKETVNEDERVERTNAYIKMDTAKIYC